MLHAAYRDIQRLLHAVDADGDVNLLGLDVVRMGRSGVGGGHHQPRAGLGRAYHSSLMSMIIGQFETSNGTDR